MAIPCAELHELTQVVRIGMDIGVHFENKGMGAQYELSCEPRSGMAMSQPGGAKHTMCDPDGRTCQGTRSFACASDLRCGSIGWGSNGSRAGVVHCPLGVSHCNSRPCSTYCQHHVLFARSDWGCKLRSSKFWWVMISWILRGGLVELRLDVAYSDL